MYDLKKVTWVKRMIAVVVCLLILLLGVLIGTKVSSKENKPVVKVETKEKQTQPSKELSRKEVKDFLIAYYTKKDLGENRKRYEPLVTTSMLNELTAEEKAPVNQAYKGYIVNQVFEQADIYIDDENSTAICVVTYRNTQRAKIGTDEGALKNQRNQEAIKLSFLAQGKYYLVNRMENVRLSAPSSRELNSYEKMEDLPEDNDSKGEVTPNLETEKNQVTEGE